MSKKWENGKRNLAIFIIVISLIVLGVLSVYYKYMKRQQMQESVHTPTTETEKLIAKDLEMGYPETPKEIIKLFGRINQCIYNKKLSDEDFSALVKQLRVLYCEDLKKINEQSQLESSIKQSADEYKSDKRKIVNYTIDEEQNYQYKTINGVEAVYLKFSTFMREGNNYSTWNQYAILIKENDKWKIREFGSVPQENAKITGKK